MFSRSVRWCLLCIAFLGQATTAAAASLCERGERTYFTCPIGRKIVSLCGSDSLGAEAGYIQYRFGSGERIELTYLELKEHPSRHFTLYSSAFSRGGISHINFSIGDHTYIVYDRLIGGFVDGRPEGHEHSAGVLVTRTEKVLAHLKCKETAGARIASPLSQVLKEGGGYQYWLFNDEI